MVRVRWSTSSWPEGMMMPEGTLSKVSPSSDSGEFMVPTSAARSRVPARPGGKGRHLGARADIAVEVGHGSLGRPTETVSRWRPGLATGTEVVDREGEDARSGPGAPGGDLAAVEGDGVGAGGRHPQEAFGAPGGEGDVRGGDQALGPERSGQGRGIGRPGERVRRDGDGGRAGSATRRRRPAPSRRRRSSAWRTIRSRGAPGW